MKRGKLSLIFLIAVLLFFILFFIHSSNAAIVPPLNFSGAGPIYSSITISNGYLYFGSNDYNVYQLNASTLQQIANYTTKNFVQVTPVVFNSSLYIGNYDGFFYQLNATNVSQQIANYSVYLGSFAKATPAIFNNSVYIGSSSFFYQLNATNVSQQIANFTGAVLAGFGNTLSTVSNGYIYIGGAQFVYQLNATNVSLQITNYTILGTVYSSVAVSNRSLYFSDNLGFFYQLNATNVSQQIANYTLKGGTSSSSPIVSNGYVYEGDHYNVFYQLNATNVSQQIGTANFTISNQTNADCWASPAAANGFVYAGNSYNTFYQLNATNVSQQIANYTTVGAIYSAPVVSGNYVYVGDGSGRVYQFNSSNINLINIYCSESWSCTNWGGCYGSVQTRTCTDANSCGTTNNMPTLSQSCTSGSGLPLPPNQNSTETDINTITSGQPSTIGITNSNINVLNITVNANQNITNARIIVSKTGIENLLKIPFGIFYQAFHINTTISNENLNNVTLEFRVNQTWLIQQNRSYNDVVLYRIPDVNSSSWQSLTTTSIRNDSTYYYFSALSPGFSTFVILVGNSGTIKCTLLQKRCFNNEIQSCDENGNWITTEQCSNACENAQCVQTLLRINISFIYYGGMIIIGVVIIILLFFMFRRFKKK